MKKQKLWLWVMVLGNLCMSCSLFLSPIIQIPIDLVDFLKGFGVSMILISFYMKVNKRKCFYERTGNIVQ